MFSAVKYGCKCEQPNFLIFVNVDDDVDDEDEVAGCSSMLHELSVRTNKKRLDQERREAGDISVTVPTFFSEFVM